MAPRSLPTRRASLGTRQRPMTACANGHDMPTLSRTQISRYSLNPTYEYDILDWRSFSRDQEREEHAAVAHALSDPPVPHLSNSRTMPHQRRHSSLSQSLRNGFSELRSLGRRMSLTVRGKNPRHKDEMTETKRPQLLPFKSDQKMMDLTEAVSSRPKSRGWLSRTPSTCRRPSLPLLNPTPEPWQLRDTPIEHTSTQKSRPACVVRSRLWRSGSTGICCGSERAISRHIHTPFTAL